jgi:hypothetical protein
MEPLAIHVGGGVHPAPDLVRASITTNVSMSRRVLAMVIYHSSRAYALWRIDKYGFDTVSTGGPTEATTLETSGALRGGGTVGERNS